MAAVVPVDLGVQLWCIISSPLDIFIDILDSFHVKSKINAQNMTLYCKKPDYCASAEMYHALHVLHKWFGNQLRNKLTNFSCCCIVASEIYVGPFSSKSRSDN